MNKKTSFFGVILILSLGLFLFSISQKDAINLNIVNSTKEEINSLELRYNDKKIKVIDVKPKSKKKVSIESSFIKTEGSLSIFYEDKNGNTQKIVAIGYIMPGQKVSATLNIVEIDENGVLKIK